MSFFFLSLFCSRSENVVAFIIFLHFFCICFLFLFYFFHFDLFSDNIFVDSRDFRCLYMFRSYFVTFFVSFLLYFIFILYYMKNNLKVFYCMKNIVENLFFIFYIFHVILAFSVYYIRLICFWIKLFFYLVEIFIFVIFILL